MADIGKKAWGWVPTLYFAEGIPYVVVATSFAMVMFVSLGLSNAEASLYTGWLYLPWVIKPFWGPFVDAMKTKRWWILLTQLVIGAGLAGVAFSIPTDYFVQVSLSLLWLVAFSSATHDISADGFYLLALSEKEQSFFVGIRSTFYRISMIVGQGALVYLAGELEKRTGDARFAWSTTLLVVAGLFLFLLLYHFFILPKPEKDVCVKSDSTVSSFFSSFKVFFTKKNIWISLLFILTYRLGESQLAKLSSPFLLDSLSNGGLALSKQSVGVVYGTIGVIALTVGGILGGVVVSKTGLKKSLYPMMFCMNVPNILYVLMASYQPSSIIEISAMVAVEQFGYGYGFTAFMLFLIYVAQGEYQTSHYALCTGFMALGMMVPGMPAGWIQEMLGYQNFFVWVCLCTIPSFFVAAYLDIDEDFGRK